MRCLTWLLVCLVLGGCATAAQQESQRMQRGLQELDRPMQECSQRMDASSSYKLIRRQMAGTAEAPTLEQLSNPAKATPEEVRALYDLHQNYITPCRKIILQAAAVVSAGHVAIMADWFAKSDANYLRIAQGTVTWGQANKAAADAGREAMSRIAQADAELGRSLAQSHNAEIARRQQAAAALSNYVYQQQVLIQNQQMIDAANRPRVTNCQYVGAYLNCTTY